MRYFILLFLFSLNSYAIDWSFKYSGFSEIKKLNFNSSDEAINFNNYGTWEDSLGNYGEGKCQGMSTIEDNQNDMKFYCEYVDQDNEKMIGKGIRKSDINAGVGKMVMIDGEGKWKKIIGAECTYVIKYKEEYFLLHKNVKK